MSAPIDTSSFKSYRAVFLSFGWTLDAFDRKSHPSSRDSTGKFPVLAGPQSQLNSGPRSIYPIDVFSSSQEGRSGAEGDEQRRTLSLSFPLRPEKKRETSLLSSRTRKRDSFSKS